MLCISESFSIRAAMKQLDLSERKTLFVTEGKKLLATITDGDIRRHLLRGGQLEDAVSLVAQYKPKVTKINNIGDARKTMIKEQISSIPVVNNDNELLDVIFLHDNLSFIKKDLNIPVVVMAGGEGTRLYPYTKVLPKPLIPIGDIPIIEHIMNKFLEYGCTDFHYLVHYKKQMIKAYFHEEATQYNITFYDEDAPLGTGGGLNLLQGYIDKPFFMTNCDSLLYADYNDIYLYHREQNNLVTMVCVYKHIQMPYGIVEMDDAGNISSMQEKPEYTLLTNTGFYVIEPKVLMEIEHGVSISFPDILIALQKRGEKIGVYPVGESLWLDMGQPDEMDRMRRKLGYDE